MPNYVLVCVCLYESVCVHSSACVYVCLYTWVDQWLCRSTSCGGSWSMKNQRRRWNASCFCLLFQSGLLSHRSVCVTASFCLLRSYFSFLCLVELFFSTVSLVFLSSIHTSKHLPVHPFVHHTNNQPCIYSSIYLPSFIHTFIQPFMFLQSIHPSFHLPTHLSINSYIHSSVHPWSIHPTIHSANQ